MKTQNLIILKNKSLKITYLSFILSTFLIFTSCTTDDVCDDITFSPYPRACTLGLDVAFLIDYTGSMGHVIDGIKANIPTIVSAIDTKSLGNYSLSLSIFDEYGKDFDSNYSGSPEYLTLPPAQRMIVTTGPTTDQHLTVLEPFSYQNETSFTSQLSLLNGTLPLGSGWGFAEPGGLLLEQILPTNNFAGTWRPGITRLAIIITDAPAGGDDDIANAIDDAFLTSLAAITNTPGDEVQVILITSLATSNYDSFLVSSNIGGLSIMNADLNNIGDLVIDSINQLCINNASSRK